MNTQEKAVTAQRKRCRRRHNVDLLSTHTIPTTYGEWLKRLLIILVKSLFISGIGFWQETLGMKNARFDPVVRIVLYVLQIHANYVLVTSQLLYTL